MSTAAPEPAVVADRQAVYSCAFVAAIVDGILVPSETVIDARDRHMSHER